MTVIIFLIILAILILVHEFGHFIVAKKAGIRVDEFGLGFPPKIFSKMYNGTLYTLNAIPFGGFVKIFGEDAHSEEISEENKSTSFAFKPKWIQALVLVAGVTMNVIFAWFLFSLGFVIGQPAPLGYSSFGEVRNEKLLITEVVPDSAAKIAGLTAGDEILRLVTTNGDAEGNIAPEDFKNLVQSSTGDVEITYKRGNLEDTISVTPKYDEVSKSRLVGVAMESIGTLKLPIHLALLEGGRTTWLILKATTVGLLGFLWDAVKFESDFSQVAGPVGIAGVVREASDLGFTYLLSVVALISINLAVINLLPFPALDGGRLLLTGIEAVIRRPISPIFVRWVNTVGFVLLLILMVIVTTSDIFKLF